MSHAPEIRDCLGPKPHSSQPRWQAPAGSWDMQFHVLGPPLRHPYSPARHYTPPPALLADYLRLAELLGIDHAMVVHANTQGPDNEIYLEAVTHDTQCLAAVVRLDRECTPSAARALHARGARGARFAFNPQHGGSLDTRIVAHVIDCVRDLGWFLQLHFAAEDLCGLRPWIETLDIPVVIDHLGRVNVSDGIDAVPARALLALAERPNIWIKLSGLDRVCPRPHDYSAATPLVQRLLDVAADRMLWGSDWPHTGYFESAQMPDDVALFDAVLELVPDEAQRTALLRDNPRRLLDLPRSIVGAPADAGFRAGQQQDQGLQKPKHRG